MSDSFVYLRKSTSDQDLNHQLNSIQDTYDVEHASVIREQGSAWKDHHKHREQFKELYEAVKQGRVDEIFVFDLDRLYRNRRRQADFIKLCDAKNCEVWSVNQQFFRELKDIPAPWDEIMREHLTQIFGYLAEEESKKRSQRIRSAYKDYDGDDWGRPSKDDKSEDVIRLRDEEGMSWRDIGEEIDASHMTAKRIYERNKKR